MKTGPVIKSPKYRWYEPQHTLVGAEYFAHAWGEHERRRPAPCFLACAAWLRARGQPSASEQYRCTIHMHDRKKLADASRSYSCLAMSVLTAGTIYVLSGRVAADLAAMRDGALRHFANEGEWSSLGAGGQRCNVLLQNLEA